MSTQSGSRKRQAPGTIPIPPLPQPLTEAANLQLPQTLDQDATFSSKDYQDFLANFTTNNTQNDGSVITAYPNGSTTGPLPFAPSNHFTNSNQLVRRDANNQLAARPMDMGAVSWPITDPPVAQSWVVPNESPEFHTADAEQTRARDSPAKKKQIPPFVLKLWKFLDGEEYSTLIRWTDNGTAFIVLNEDEFARTVIPEFYKHNNFASFVRQLNMYGFSKRPSIHAHSMKAAERKVKEPPIWSHKYFQKGREDLLYLIQKPPNKNSTGKRRRVAEAEQGDSDDDAKADPKAATASRSTNSDPQDLVTLPRSEVKMLREEIHRLQQQQGMISRMIAQLTQKNEQFNQQASNFQNLHDRHENSINAILTFLATFYNRSLEAGVDLNNMFGNLPQREQQGTVVDVGDSDFGDGRNPTRLANNLVQRYRAPQLLLENSPAPASARPSTVPPPSRFSTSPAVDEQWKPGPTPTKSEQPAWTNMQGDPSQAEAIQPLDSPEMLSLINAANANTPSDSFNDIDFSSVLNHAQHANGKQPLTPGQRRDMLNLIASQGHASTSQPGANNALMNPNPPPMPSLEQRTDTQEKLSQLTQMQRLQDAKVQQLAGRLSPLSPTGNIPGLNDAYGFSGTPPPLNLNSGLGAPSSDFDINAFINDTTDNDDSYFSSLLDNSTADAIGAPSSNVNDNDNGKDLFGDMTNDTYDTNNDTETRGLLDSPNLRGRVESLGSSSSMANSPAVSGSGSTRG